MADDARFEVLVRVTQASSALRVQAMAPRLRAWRASGARVRLACPAWLAPRLGPLTQEFERASVRFDGPDEKPNIRLFVGDGLAEQPRAPSLRWILSDEATVTDDCAPAWRAGLPDPTDERQRALLAEYSRMQDPACWSAQAVANRLLTEAERAGGIGIHGCGMVGRRARAIAAAAGIATLFWVDSNPSVTGTSTDGLPVYWPQRAPDAPIVLAGGAAHAMGSVWRTVDRAPPYGLSALHLAVREPGHPERDWQAEALARPGHFLALMALLDGSESMRVLEGLLRFRRTLANEALWNIRSANEQWFDRDYFARDEIRSLVDCGGYDGDTARAFLHHVPDGEVVVVEPDSALADAARASLRGRRARVVWAAVGASAGTARFHPVEGMSGSVSDSLSASSVAVPVVRIDDCVEARPDMLKLDVEGQEAAALAGAPRTLASHPLVAVAVYHRAEDLTRIPRMLAANGYSAMGLRHYTGLAYESVAYATRRPSVGMEEPSR
jgi:FkbM family methyltransferase